MNFSEKNLKKNRSNPKRCYILVDQENILNLSPMKPIVRNSYCVEVETNLPSFNCVLGIKVRQCELGVAAFKGMFSVSKWCCTRTWYSLIDSWSWELKPVFHLKVENSKQGIAGKILLVTLWASQVVQLNLSQTQANLIVPIFKVPRDWSEITADVDGHVFKSLASLV